MKNGTYPKRSMFSPKKNSIFNWVEIGREEIELYLCEPFRKSNKKNNWRTFLSSSNVSERL